MAIIDDIVAQQLRQYPGGPVDPVRAVLPQSYADQYTGGLRPVDPAMAATVPGKEEEALQPSDTSSELINRWYGPGFRRQYGQQTGDLITSVISQVAPLMLGAMGDEEGEGGGILDALRGPVRKTSALSTREQPIPALRFPSGVIHMGQPDETMHYQILQRLLDEHPNQHVQFLKPESGWIWKGKFHDRDEMTALLRRTADAAYPGMEGTAGTTFPFQPARGTARFFGDEVYPYSSAERAAIKRKFPESAHETYSAASSTKVLPRPYNQRDATDIGIAEQPSRYHGATNQEPIRVVLPPEIASHPGNLLGQGFYTTDDVYVAGGYGHPTYNVYEINPGKLKFLDANKESVPQNVLDRVTQILPNTVPDRNSPSGVQAIKNRWLLNRNALAKEKAYKVFTRFTDQSTLSKTVQVALRQAMEDEGYAGITHIGGGITQGAPHRVKIYFNPGRDVRMRVMPSDEWKSVYVRDKPVPGAPGLMGFRLGKERVPAPVVAGRTGIAPGMDIHGNVR